MWICMRVIGDPRIEDVKIIVLEMLPLRSLLLFLLGKEAVRMELIFRNVIQSVPPTHVYDIEGLYCKCLNR